MNAISSYVEWQCHIHIKIPKKNNSIKEKKKFFFDRK